MTYYVDTMVIYIFSIDERLMPPYDDTMVINICSKDERLMTPYVDTMVNSYLLHR